MITARRTPDPPPPYYAPDSLERERVDVLLCVGGMWGVGCMARENVRRHFYMRHDSGKYLRVPPKGAIAWCPINAADWPDLPTPMRDDLVWSHPYSLPGSITAEEAAVRVCRALRGARIVTVFEGPPWKRTELDRKDEIVATRWYTALDNEDRFLIDSRAMVPPRAWRELGEALDISPTTARKRYVAVLERLCRIANKSASAVA